MTTAVIPRFGSARGAIMRHRSESRESERIVRLWMRTRGPQRCEAKARAAAQGMIAWQGRDNATCPRPWSPKVHDALHSVAVDA